LDTEAPNAAGDISGDFSTGLQIKAGTIVNADVSATAAIAGSKITPNFVAQNISTTGTTTAGGGVAAGSTSQFTVNGTGNITKINNVVTSFPAAQGAAGTVLTNDGAGILSWAPTTSKSKFLITDPNSTDTALTAKTYSNQLHGYAISGIQSGTGDAAGFFLIDNPANTFAAVYGETRGSGGAGVMGTVFSTTGSGGKFQNFNAANPDPVVTIVNDGTGSALEITGGHIVIDDGTQAAGRVLTSDANGLATWQAAGAGSGWVLSGNAGTTDGNLLTLPATGDFVGTTDATPLNFRVDNIESGRISADDNGGTYFGFRAGERESLTGPNPSPRFNTGFGNKAVWKNTTGQNNTGVGQGALAESNGSNNTAMGQGSLSNNTTGNNNTGYGALTLVGNQTGSGNTAIGEAADVTATNLTNATAIGFQTTVNASNKVRIGNGSVTVIEGAVSYTFPSDIRLKKDVRNIDEGLEFINSLRPVSFRMRNGDPRLNWGFIAQEVEALLGTENALLTVGGDEARTLGLRYSDFVAPMVKSVQELNAKLEALEAENQKLKTALLEAMNEKEKLASENKDLESKVNTIQGDVDEIKRVLNISASKN
jgi:hypothetical protein